MREVARRMGTLLEASLVLRDVFPPRDLFSSWIFDLAMLGVLGLPRRDLGRRLDLADENRSSATRARRADKRLGGALEDAGLKPGATGAFWGGRHFCSD